MGRSPAKTALALVLIAGVTGMTAACAPQIRNHGFTPPDEDLAQIRVGQDTRGSVLRKIGRPGGSGVFTDEGWYYVSEKVEHLTYHAPEVIERRVVAVVFDPNDVVASVSLYGLEDGLPVDLETNTTPTYGRELTIIEQAIGNIGLNTGNVFEN